LANSLRLSRRALLSSTMLSLAAPTVAPALASAKTVYRDAKASIEARVSDLLGRMTLDEKAAQLRSMWATKPLFLGDDKNFSEDRAARSLTNGIGQISRISDFRGYPEWDRQPYRTIENTITLANAVQRFLVEKTRLGIPALFHDELAHGFLANDATIFPIPTALGSTWDPDLVEQVFTVAARQARLRGTTIALTPVIDLLRDPRFGRSEEFFGEDPRLVADMGTAAVLGLQGHRRPIAKDRVFATLKHFVHASPQGGINISPADVSERAMRENYLVPFQRVIRDADPAIVMPSYNEIQGVPSHANVELLQATGRRRLGFQGVYFSDYDGIANLKNQHHVTGSLEDAAILAVNAGVQADLPEGESYAQIPALVRAGRIAEEQVDAAVTKILALKFEAGLFENPYLDLKHVRQATNMPADITLARKAAEKAIILLKNDGTLPIEPRAGLRLAVIGPNAAEALFGGYSGENAKTVGILEGIRNTAPQGVVIEHAEGVWITPPDDQRRHKSFSPTGVVSETDDARRIAEAVQVAKRADIVLLVLGDVPAITRETVHPTLPGDRSSLGLWGRQDELVQAIAATGKKVVTLLLNGRPLAVPGLAEKSNALFEGWYLGQEGGNAFADILFGVTNPGGKLPVSLPRSVGALPDYYNRHPTGDLNPYIEGPRSALFPFGHGLSYTSFEISAPRLITSTIAVGEAAEIEVDVTNTGKRAGDEVVQIYIRDDVSSVPRPVLELKAYKRVALAAGESQTLQFKLMPDDLAFWNIDMKWVVEPGTFTIHAGNSSAHLKSVSLRVS
jgi:beta-glucosidase